MLYGIVCLIICMIVIWYRDTFKTKQVTLTLALPHLKQSIRAVQLTDLHGHMFKGSLEFLYQEIKHTQPEIIFLTGDMIDRHTSSFDKTLEFIKKLTKISSVYFVMGNHEVSHDNQELFLNELTNFGVHVLINDSVRIKIADNTLQIVGVGDASSFEADVNKAFLDVKERIPTILLSHTPNIVDQLTDESAQIILCGHTHGGQIRLPLIGALLAPDQGFFPKRTKGIYQIAKNRQLYVDSGLGMSRIPVRLFNRSQYSCINFVPSQPENSHAQDLEGRVF